LGLQALTLFTSLATSAQSLEATEAMISSLMDTWILMAIEPVEGVRTRNIYVLKSRGMPHSNDVRSYVIGDRGVSIQSPRSKSNGSKARKSR